MYKKILILVSLLFSIGTSSYGAPLLKSLKSHAKICRTQGGIERLLDNSKSYNNPSSSCFILMQSKKVEVLSHHKNTGLIDTYYKIYYQNTVHYVRARDISIDSNTLEVQQSHLVHNSNSTKNTASPIQTIPTLNTVTHDTNKNQAKTIHKAHIKSTPVAFTKPIVKTKKIIPQLPIKTVKRKKSVVKHTVKKRNSKKKLKNIKKKYKSKKVHQKKKYIKRKHKKHTKHSHKKSKKVSKIYHCTARSQSATGWAKSIYLQDAKNKAYKECTKRNISPLACFIEACYEEKR